MLHVTGAALDANNNLIGFHVKTGGTPESPLYPNRFQQGQLITIWPKTLRLIPI
ncbi:MAG: hypothetical protein R2822_09400 [Spirosomataceae bacterium]